MFSAMKFIFLIFFAKIVVMYAFPIHILSVIRANSAQNRMILQGSKKHDLDTTKIYGPNGEDKIWGFLRRDAAIEAAHEPILASFMHASVLSQSSLEHSLAFHLSNLLASPAMISTQLQALFLETFRDYHFFKDSLRFDIVAVVQRDPAVRAYTDVLLYFKGFHALQTHRVAHWLWQKGRKTLGMCFFYFFYHWVLRISFVALFLHSRANAAFQIDIHPGAQLGTGILIDHGTGVVIGETAIVGDNVSMLHKVTLGGTGSQTGSRHPVVGDGVLLGAGSTLLGPIKVGQGANIGASSMVIGDVPEHSVAVGVPARILLRPKPEESSYSPALTMDTNMLFFDI